MSKGFTLIEIIIVMVLIGIIGSFIANAISSPFKLYTNILNRMELAAEADYALFKIRTELNDSVARTARVKGKAIEFFKANVTSMYLGGRYVEEGLGAGDHLLPEPGYINGTEKVHMYHYDFFDEHGGLSKNNEISQLNSWAEEGSFIIVNDSNTSSAETPVIGRNAFSACNNDESGNICTVRIDSRWASVVTGKSKFTIYDHNTNNEFKDFFIHIPNNNPEIFAPGDSPTRSIYLSEGAVSYICDEAAGTLTRYSGYDILDTQSDTAAGLSNATAHLLSNHISGCHFTYFNSIVSPQAQPQNYVFINITFKKGSTTIRLVETIRTNDQL